MTGGGVKEREKEREERVKKLGFFKKLRSDKKEVVLEEESQTGVHIHSHSDHKNIPLF